MPQHLRKIKLIEFSLDTPPIEFQCQIQSWNLANNTPEPEKIYTQCPDGESFEEVDPEYALELTFLADWRENGIADFLTANDQIGRAHV